MAVGLSHGSTSFLSHFAEGEAIAQCRNPASLLLSPTWSVLFSVVMASA